MSPTTATLTVGGTQQLTVTFNPTNATNKNVTWTTSDAEIATVENGVVKGIKAGEATITAKSNNGKIATCVVTVVEEDVIAATVDYAAVWNEARGTWYIKATVPENDIDISSVKSITVIKEAGVGLAEPRSLTPDTDKVMWFGVAKADADLTFKAAGEYAYKVVRQDNTKYIFNFTYTPGLVEEIEEPEAIQANWKSTDRTGFNTVDGVAYVFQEFELLSGEGNEEARVKLDSSSIVRITSNGKELKANTDETLWFNVLGQTGKRDFVVVDNENKVYKATLDWTAPADVTAEKTGVPAYNEEREETYQLYTVEVDVTPANSKVYQIKPNGAISELTILADADSQLNIWFRLSKEGRPQQAGDHIFLVKKGDTWSKAVINYIEPAVEATTGISPSTDEPVEGVVEFTFGFKSATGNLEELELDIYLGDNAGESRNYANHLGFNLPAGSNAVATWVDQVVAGYSSLDEKFKGLLAAAGYNNEADADAEANKTALKNNILYTAEENGAGTWTLKLDTEVLSENKIEFLVAVKDDQDAQWGNNNYTSFPEDFKAFLYNVTLPVTYTAEKSFNTENVLSSFVKEAKEEGQAVEVPATLEEVETALKARLIALQGMTGDDATGRDLSLLESVTEEDISIFAENISFSEDGKTVTINGPLFSEKAFIVAKGAKNLDSAYNLTLFKADAEQTGSGSIAKEDKLAKIQISKDRTVNVVKFE